jgi:hypothetical protein
VPAERPGGGRQELPPVGADEAVLLSGAHDP